MVEYWLSPQFPFDADWINVFLPDEGFSGFSFRSRKRILTHCWDKRPPLHPGSGPLDRCQKRSQAAFFGFSVPLGLEKLEAAACGLSLLAATPLWAKITYRLEKDERVSAKWAFGLLLLFFCCLLLVLLFLFCFFLVFLVFFFFFFFFFFFLLAKRKTSVVRPVDWKSALENWVWNNNTVRTRTWFGFSKKFVWLFLLLQVTVNLQFILFKDRDQSKCNYCEPQTSEIGDARAKRTRLHEHNGV